MVADLTVAPFSSLARIDCVDLMVFSAKVCQNIQINLMLLSLKSYCHDYARQLMKLNDH